MTERDLSLIYETLTELVWAAINAQRFRDHDAIQRLQLQIEARVAELSGGQ